MKTYPQAKPIKKIAVPERLATACDTPYVSAAPTPAVAETLDANVKFKPRLLNWMIVIT